MAKQVPGVRSAPPMNQVRQPYLPNVDADLQRELLTMRQQIQAMQTTSQPSKSATSVAFSKEQMDFIKKNLEAGGTHALNVSGLLKGF